jgi:hypothetical protein
MAFDFQRKRLTQEIADLIKQQQACEIQYRTTIDDSLKEPLKLRLDNYDQKIEQLESQLKEGDLSDCANRRFLAVEEKLPKIDFKDQIQNIKNILEQFNEYGSAIFLINDSFKKAGDLFRLEFKNLLNEETTDLQHYEIGFSVTGKLDEIGFLQELGRNLGLALDEIDNREEYSKIIEKCFNKIENGSIIFLELKKIDLLNNKEYFLSWLVNTFWKRLIEKLPIFCQFKDIEQVRFIILVTSDDDIYDEYSTLPFLCQETFNECHIFPIILDNWQEEQIKIWLHKHSGLNREKSIQIAKAVYKSSCDGTPKLICDALRNKLS